MPSVFSHAIAAVAIGGVAAGGRSRATLWALGAICAIVPDLDVVSSFFGFPYGHMLGHRGLSHSLFFAAVLAWVVTAIVRRKLPASPSAMRLWRPGRGLLRAVLQYSLFPPMAPDRGLADLGLRVRRSARSDRDVERARLGLAAGGVDLPGRPGAPA